ncbi:MAG: tRNA pseudouridine(55) synthase TruB [Fervidobacterium sp.]|nr:tRNA pseudouridine(55) synthase TruB [Fervidobacterium sp.]
MISGLILVDKEKGPTSHDIVDKVRKILGIKQVGHAGTLDPFATGLLIIGVGKATRLLEYLQGETKKYIVKMKLGIITDTFDITGKVMEEHPITVSEEDINTVINSFVGTYKQIPPAYSAKKHQGKKLYELAREGKMINLPPREVTIYEINKVKINIPYVEFEAKVSAGTYIRSLCMDIGYTLGCGATAVELRRIQVGKFRVEDSISIEFDKVDRAKLEKHTIPMEKILDYPKIVVDDKNKIYNGIHPKVDDIISMDDFNKDDFVQIFWNGLLIAVAKAERSSDFVKTLRKQQRSERVATLKKVFKNEED